LQTSDKQTITIDLKQTTMIPLPQFIQYDTNILEFVIKENGVDADLTNIGRIVVKYKRPDGEVIPRLLVAQGNIITYPIGQSEMAKSGYGNLEIHFYSLDNIYRISTKKFKVYMSESLGVSFIESENLTLLQELFVEVYNVNSQIEVTEATRQQNETTRQTQESQRQTNTTNAINRLDTSLNSLKLEYKSPVANFAALATTYPTPTVGWIAQTLDNGKFYRFNGSEWLFHSEMNNNILTDIQNRLSDANRQSQVLTHGTQILNASQNSPVDLEIQGRTLISLGNSNLLPTTYVLSGKNYKIRVEGREGPLITGVAKFTKSASLISKADFVGKVSGSVTENPHVMKRTANSTLSVPSGFTIEPDNSNYGRISTLDSLTYVTSANGSGAIAQHLISFNIIEQIERKLGRIPADTVAGKVQWIKDNVNKLTANWHGWGSSVGGNKANFALWSQSAGTWSNPVTHSNSSVTKSSYVAEVTGSSARNITNNVDSNGFIHFLAYAEPSDGTAASQLNTDFIELEIELKTTAVLDTRPVITRVANFDGKVSGSVVENPHVAKHAYNSALVAPSGTWNAEVQSAYGYIAKLDGGTYYSPISVTNGAMAQTLFSFNLIEEVERNIGRIPKATVAEKVQWLKDNVDSLIGSWNGFGSSVGGNKANLTQWRPWVSSWESAPKTHLNITVSSLSIDAKYSTSTIGNLIDTNGMIHYLAYAEPSDGITPSTINTDYVELQITLKQGATLHDPVLPLYEVDATDYGKILVDWNEAEVMNRYPKVQGTQHLQNLAVIAEGENLLPPFSEWTLHANAKIISPYELELNVTASGQGSNISLSGLGGQPYTFNTPAISNIYYDIFEYDGNGTLLVNHFTKRTSYTFITNVNTRRIDVRATSNSTTGKFTFTNPMLTLGSTAKPFVPRNPSYLFAPVKLGQIGTVKDSLFKTDGQWQLVERVKKDAVLDGSLGWSLQTDYVGFKRVRATLFSSIPSDYKCLKFDGRTLSNGLSDIGADRAGATPTEIWISISDTDTGFGENHAPTNDEIKAYFYGWQAKTVDANGKPTAWRSLGDGTDAPTQTLAYVSTIKAPNFTPYKLSYILTAPQTINVSHLVEGDIVVSGPTHVEVNSGVVVREKVTPALYSGTYFINDINLGSAYLKNKPEKILNVYANGQIEKGWSLVASNAVGKQKATLPSERFNPTAEYTVTYLVLDRHLFTVNATEVKASFAGNFKEVQDMQVEKVSDLAAQQSVMANQMYRVLVAAKGAGWNV
jgi:hypothetical protein